MSIINPPIEFQPYLQWRAEGNIFEQVHALLTVGGQAPLLIGQGTTPRLWLSAPPAESGAPWRTLVADNVSTDPSLKIEAFARRLALRMSDATLLSATVADQDILQIHKLDLRCVGLALYADADGLHLMGSTLRNSHFQNVPIVLALPG
jgi:hypothetical protein